MTSFADFPGKPLWIAIIATMLVTGSTAVAGHGTITGRETEGWDDGVYVVLIGVIQDVQKEQTTGEDVHFATFVPHATIAGAFDPSTHPILPVKFVVGRPTSSIAQAPEEGAVVLAVVQLIRAKKTGTSDTGIIYSHTCTFMPGEAALVVLKGFDDPRIDEILKRLQHARAHPDPDPYGRQKGEMPKPNDGARE
jgi:hypothetical protein